MELMKCVARFVTIKAEIFIFFAFISVIINSSESTYIHVRKYEPVSSLNPSTKINLLDQQKKHKTLDSTNKISIEEEILSKEHLHPHQPSSLLKRKKVPSPHTKQRKGKQFLATLPRYLNLKEANLKWLLNKYITYILMRKHCYNNYSNHFDFRIHHGSYSAYHRGMPFQYTYPHFMMNPSYSGKL